MKPRFFIALIGICLTLYACPVSTSYPLGSRETAEPFDLNLTGTWKNPSTDTEASKIMLSRGQAKNTYKLNVLEKGGMFMAETEEFEAWATSLNGKKFMVLQAVSSGQRKETYYLYHFTLDGKKLTTYDIKLRDFGIENIQSIDAYRAEVDASMKLADFLTAKMEWTKN